MSRVQLKALSSNFICTKSLFLRNISHVKVVDLTYESTFLFVLLDKSFVFVIGVIGNPDFGYLIVGHRENTIKKNMLYCGFALFCRGINLFFLQLCICEMFVL